MLLFVSYICHCIICMSNDGVRKRMAYVCMDGTILLSFFVIILSRYIEKGQAGSYRYYIDEYERGLLLQKIKDLACK